MRFILITCLLLGLLVLTSAQDQTDRRARLRSLISAARGGDLEARKALQGLRKQIEVRRAQGTTRARHQETFAPSTVAATTTRTTTTQRPTTEPAPIEVTTFHRRIPQRRIIEEIPQETPRHFRENQQDESLHRFAPHRTLHNALEVDDRSEMLANIRVTNRTKTPPVQTTRRYSYYDDAGNYIFGFEATDGSFREEKRGINCIVNGKYGYVDPSGIRREFTYTSGNRCDPTVTRLETEFPELQQDRVAPNDQFLIQTQEQQLDEAALNKIVFNRRRQPTTRTRQRSQKISQTNGFRQAQETPTAAPIRRPTAAPTTTRPTTAPTTTRPTAAATPRSTAARTERPITRVFVTQSPATKAPVVFKPNTRPVNFNFDEEFRNIFHHFDSNSQTSPQLRPIPSLFSQPPLPVNKPRVTNHFSQPALPVGKPKITNHFSQPPLPVNRPRVTNHFSQPALPVGKPKITNHFSQPPLPVNRPRVTNHFSQPALPVGKPKITNHFSQPPLPGVAHKQKQAPAPKAPSPVQKQPAARPQTVAHQLVFDAKTGTFTTVPLSVSHAINNPAPFTAPKKTVSVSVPKKSTGRPLQTTGFNPLPVVPLGGLSFSNSNTAREFDHFFNQFKL